MVTPFAEKRLGKFHRNAENTKASRGVLTIRRRRACGGQAEYSNYTKRKKRQSQFVTKEWGDPSSRCRFRPGFNVVIETARPRARQAKAGANGWDLSVIIRYYSA
jgi:hypothetical protein